MTIKELYDTLNDHFLNGGSGNRQVEVFEVRSSCTMPVLSAETNSDGDLCIIVDQADS